MKKLSIMCTAILIASAFIGCTSTAEESKDAKDTKVSVGTTDSADAEKESKKDEKESKEQEADIILYDANDVKITYKGFSQGGIFSSADFKFLIENNSDKEFTVTSRNVSVNDLCISDFLYEEIGAGKKANEAVTLYDYQLKESNIENIGKIEFNLAFINPDTYDTVFESDKITITLDESVKSGEIPEGSKELYSQDGISVYYVSLAEKGFVSDTALKFFIQNDSDKNVNISSKDVCINGFTVDLSSMYQDVEAKKKSYDTLEIFNSDLEKNEIEKVEKVEFSLKCTPVDNIFEPIWESEPIVIELD